ncbi:MAG TPA: MJ0042-type zinc finger domain-containing protein [Steroidobacteraceae bacterium]|nr:MJ0042-type zinc finger domain-containing protein [Steroidobacteraceae bacterium]
MYSQCPECQARFRVTAAALRAAHGTVRCGRCGSAFDALERLSDEIPPVEPPEPAIIRDASAAEEPSARVEPVPAEFHFTTEDLEKVFIDAQDWQRRFAPTRPAAEEPGPEEAGDDAPLVVVEEPARIEDITLEGERISLDELPS